MKHAGPEALDQLEPILEEIRRLGGLKEKKRGGFYCGSRGISHFHEGPMGVFPALVAGVVFLAMSVLFKMQSLSFFVSAATRSNVSSNSPLSRARVGPDQ